MLSGPLKDLRERDELEVLHAGQQLLLGVVHPDPDLDPAHDRIGKERGHFDQGVRCQPAVGVQHRHDHVFRIPITQNARGAQVPVGGVQGLTLPLLGIRQGALEQPDPLGVKLAHHICRAVVRGVVDDHDLEVAGNGQQPLQAPGDHSLLIQARDEEHEQQIRGSRQGSLPAVPREQQHPEAVQTR